MTRITRALQWAFLPLTAATFTAAGTQAQENFELGRMWTFERPPLDYLEKEYGFRPTQQWLDFVRMASLRFGDGCSASFVSSKGLILTNHHCVRGNIAENQGSEDWVANGYVAKGPEDEVRLDGLTVQQLVESRDVTAQIDDGIDAGDNPEAVAQKRRDNERTVLEAAAAKAPDLEHELVVLFQGAIRMLYSYKIYDDIRLVVAPELQAAHFGGDFDNFTYPRYCSDFAFCRAYENGKPADTKQFFFRWRLGGAAENELVFITGNPGTTKRLLTKAQFEYQRDGYLPWVRELIDNRLAIMKGFAERSPQLEKALRTNILRFENAQKAFRGQHGGLLDPAFMARKEEAETHFRNRIDADAQHKAEHGKLWDEIATVAGQLTEIEFPRRFHAEGGSTHLMRAVQIVRAAAAEEPEARDELLQAAFAIPMRTDPIQSAFFVDHIERARGKLPADDPYLSAILDNGSLTPEEAAERIASTKVSDRAYAEKLVEGGNEAIQTSSDFAIRIASVIVPLADRNERLVAELEQREEDLGVRMGRALFAAYGDTVSPDATFTLRFSDGRVKGYDYNGTKAPWRTTMYGLYARAEEFDFEYPWVMPKSWIESKDRVDLTAPINFVATNDSTGGNSGSPMIDKDGNLVGLLFDGNIESLPNDFIYRENSERSVLVHVDGILEGLLKVYDAGRIATELFGDR